MAGKNIGLVLQCQSLLYVTRWHASIPADKSYCDHSIIYQYNFTAQSSSVCHSYSHWVSKSLMSLPRHTLLELSIYPAVYQDVEACSAQNKISPAIVFLGAATAWEVGWVPSLDRNNTWASRWGFWGWRAAIRRFVQSFGFKSLSFSTFSSPELPPQGIAVQVGRWVHLSVSALWRNVRSIHHLRVVQTNFIFDFVWIWSSCDCAHISLIFFSLFRFI